MTSLAFHRPDASAERPLAASAAQLHLAIDALEREFLRTGEQIMAITSTSEALVQASEQLTAMAMGREGGESAAAAAAVSLRAPLAFLEEEGPAIARLIGLLRDNRVRVRATLAREADLRRVMQPLGYVQTLLRIDASRLDPVVENMILAQVSEIERLKQHVEAVCDEQFRELRAAHDTVDRLVGELTRQATARQQAADERRAAVATSIALVERRASDNAAREVDLSVVSGAVGQEVGKLVMALQYHDILSQKLAHVREGAERIDDRLAGLGALEDADTRGSTLRNVAVLGQVIDGQLTAVEVEMAAADTAVQSALETIAERMRTLDATCLAMHDVEAVSAGADGLVQVMLEALAQVRVLLDGGRDLVIRAEHDIAPIGDVLQSVGTRLGHIAHGMRLVGLNSQVQSARVTIKSGLDELSATISAIAIQTDQISDDVARDLRETGRSFTEGSALLAELARGADVQSAHLQATGGETERELHAFRDATLARLADVARHSDDLMERLQPLLARDSFTGVMVEAMAIFRDAAALVTASAAAEADALGVSEQSAADAAAMRAHYTMASERRVHDAALRHEDAALRRDVRAGSVEMFDDEAGPASRSPAAAASGSDTNEVDLWL
jgi:hypothetical protein